MGSLQRGDGLNELLIKAERLGRGALGASDNSVDTMRLGSVANSYDYAAETERFPTSSTPRDEARLSESQSAERPQVLAQLSKAISDLIQGKKSPSVPAAAPMEPAPRQGSPFTEQFAHTFGQQQPEPMGLGERLASEAVPRSSPVLAPHIAPSLGSAFGERASPSSPQDNRHQAAKRSPREVQVLLSSIESREAALHAKVQQLAEEKSIQQQRLEDEVNSLRRANAQMQVELNARHASEAHHAYERPSSQPSSRPRSPIAERSEPSIIMQSTREELQQQLAEIRAEVARCASALCADEPLPSSEVADIRQQLAALCNEVRQTSHALLPSGDMLLHGANTSSNGELAAVRGQLEALQTQVSRAMYAALSRPGAPMQLDPQSSEVMRLRQEVSLLRNQLTRTGSHTDLTHAASSSGAPRAAGLNMRQSASRHLQGELGAQIEALRMEMGSVNGASPAQARIPALPGSAALHRIPSQPQQTQQRPAPETASLQERLSWLRAEVARVVQDPRYAEDNAPPEMKSRLGNLLRELAELRHGAEAVAAAAGSPAPRRGSAASQHMVPGGQQQENGFLKGAPSSQSVQSRSSSTPLRQLRPNEGALFAGNYFADLRRTQVQSSALQSLMPAPGSASIGPSAVAELSGHSNRYVDRERLALDGVMRGAVREPSQSSVAASSKQSSGMPFPGEPSTLGIGCWQPAPASPNSGHQVSLPAAEPSELSPQGNMWRPQRSKIAGRHG